MQLTLSWLRIAVVLNSFPGWYPNEAHRLYLGLLRTHLVAMFSLSNLQGPILFLSSARALVHRPCFRLRAMNHERCTGGRPESWREGVIWRAHSPNQTNAKRQTPDDISDYHYLSPVGTSYKLYRGIPSSGLGSNCNRLCGS